MALTDEGGGIPATMLVGPTGYNPYPQQGGFGGFGGDGWWVILLLLAFGGGWGGGFGGWGGGGFGGMYEFPWLLNGQQNINSNTNAGFRDSMLQDSITSVRDGVSALATQLCGCCGDLSTQMCNGFSGVTAAVTGAAPMPGAGMPGVTPWAAIRPRWATPGTAKTWPGKSVI